MSEEMNNEMIEDVDAAATEEQAGAQPQEDGQEQPKKYTDADVDKIVARKIAAERKRVAKLAEAEQQESDLERREKELMKRELMADARDELAEKGLPLCIKDILNYGSREEYEQSMKAAQDLVAELHKAWEIKRATGRTPANYANHSGSQTEAIRNAFRP